MSYSIAGDSVFSDSTYASVGTGVTAQTVSAVAPGRGESPVIAKKGWFDTWWSCMLDDDSDKESEVVVKREKAAQQTRLEYKKRLDFDADGREEIAAELRESDPRAFLETNDRRTGRDPFDFPSEKDRREYMEFRKWKSRKERASRGSLSWSDDDDDDEESLELYSEYKASRRRGRDDGRPSTESHRRVFDEGSIDTYESFDPVATCLTSESFGANYGDGHKEHKRRFRRTNSSGSRRGYSRERQSQSRSRSRPREIRGILRRGGKRESSRGKSRESKGRIEDRRRSSHRGEVRELPPRHPKHTNNGKVTKSSLSSKQSGKLLMEQQDSEKSQRNSLASLERERVQEAQELMQDKGIKARDALQVARNEKRDDIDKQNILELKTDGEPKETKIILPPSLPLPHTPFNIPERRRAHSFDGFRLASRRKPSAPIVKGTPNFNESKKQDEAASKSTTDSKELEKEGPSVSSKAKETQPESPEVTNGRDASSSSRCKTSGPSSDNREGTTASTDSNPDPSPLSKDEAPQEMTHRGSLEQLRSCAVPYLPWKGGAVFHRKPSTSMSVSSDGSTEKKEQEDSPRPEKSMPALELKDDRYSVKETISGVQASPPQHVRRYSIASMQETRSENVKEKRKVWKPAFFKTRRSDDTASVISSSAVSLGRKSSRSGSRLSRGLEAESIASLPW